MRLAIVEDNRLLLENLRLIFGGQRDIEVVGVYSSAEEALEGISRITSDSEPELIVVDLGLPGMSGVELIVRLKDIMPDLLIMAHTIYEDKENVFAAIKAGASGYLLKGSTPRELIEGVFSLYDGGAPMSPRIARKLINEFQLRSDTEEFLLSAREKDIITEIAKGNSYKAIGYQLGISPNTVHSHIKRIYEKLHARDRKDAILAARKKGII